MSYTINTIQDEMNAAGSHWWDRDTMRCFGTRASEKVYQGEDGIFFVTSEKPPHGKRAYSVRQYKPDAKSVDTVGEFCELTRSQAHTAAARLAGPAAIVVESAHKPTSDVEQLCIDIDRGGGCCNKLVASWLIRLATKHHKMMEDYCNGVEIYDEDGEALPRLQELRTKCEEAAEAAGCKGVNFSGDPRGATVRLILPNEDTNDWAKEGWIVPTRD